MTTITYSTTNGDRRTAPQCWACGDPVTGLQQGPRHVQCGTCGALTTIR